MIEPILPPFPELEAQNEKIQELLPLMPEVYTHPEKVTLALRVLLYQAAQAVNELEKKLNPPPPSRKKRKVSAEA